MRKHGGTPSWRDKQVTLAAISPPGVARGRFVGGQQSGLAGSKPPPLFTREASSCSSQGRRQGEPWGASPRPSAPTYLPWAFLVSTWSRPPYHPLRQGTLTPGCLQEASAATSKFRLPPVGGCFRVPLAPAPSLSGRAGLFWTLPSLSHRTPVFVCALNVVTFDLHLAVPFFFVFSDAKQRLLRPIPSQKCFRTTLMSLVPLCLAIAIPARILTRQEGAPSPPCTKPTRPMGPERGHTERN